MKGIRIIYSGLIAGFISELILGGLFMSSFIQRILYNPQVQSHLFIDVTPQRDLIPSITGIIFLSIIHSWLFSILQPSIPGKTQMAKGFYWGFFIWLLYWVFQEWFIYHTLLKEPLLLNLLELAILFLGSIAEGIVIALLIMHKPIKQKKQETM